MKLEEWVATQEAEFAKQQVIAELVLKQIKDGLIDTESFLAKATLDAEQLPDEIQQKVMIKKLIFAAGHAEAPEKIALLLTQIKINFDEALKHCAIGELVTIRVGNIKGGRKGGGKNRKVDPEKVRADYNKLNKPERNRASILAERLGVTPDAIRKALRRAEEKR